MVEDCLRKRKGNEVIENWSDLDVDATEYWSIEYGICSK